MGMNNYTMFLMNDGTVKAVGFNQYAQLGLGYYSTVSPYLVLPISDLSLINVKQIACDGFHTVFLMNDGTVKGAGSNSWGQLGLDDRISTDTIRDLPLTDVKQIACGSNWTMFLMNDGTVKGVGYNASGQLGLGHKTDTYIISNLSLTDVKQIACGDAYTMFLMNDGTVKGVGNNNFGQLGLGYATTVSPYLVLPISNSSLTNVKQITCGFGYTMFLMNDGTVKGVGRNSDAQLGLENITSSNTIRDLSLTNVKQIACGQAHTMFLMNDGTVKAVGFNQYAQLGLGHKIIPIITIRNLSLTNVKQIACGTNHTMFLMKDGTVKAVGQNQNAQLGLGYKTSVSPYAILSISNLSLTGAKRIADSYTFEIITMKYLFRDISDVKTFTNQWSLVTQATPIEEDFTSYGMYNLPSMENIKLLTSPEVLIWTDGAPTQLVHATKDREIKFLVSFDNQVNWYSYSNGWNQVLLSNIRTQGMFKSVIEGITSLQWKEVFVEGTVDLAIWMRTNDETVTLVLTQIQVELPALFKKGNALVTTKLNQFNTIDFDKVNGVVITEDRPTYTDIRYAFSNDARQTWKVFVAGNWATVTLSNLYLDGMSREQVELLTSENWALMINTTLDVAICLTTNDSNTSPSVDHFTLNYDQIPNPLYGNEVEILVPELGFRNNLVNGTYILKVAEGLAFDDATVDYNFYTTPDRIKLRPVDIGNIIGGSESQIYAVEIINGFEDKGFEITLRSASQDGTYCAPMGSYALLNDHADIDKRTKIELSLLGGVDFNPIYPLAINLPANMKKLFYIKIKPSIYTSIGSKGFQIKLVGRPI